MNTYPILNWRILAITFVSLCASSPALAAGVLAGSLIENTAQATFDVGDGIATIDSNTVTIRVDEVLDVTVTLLDSGALNASPGSTVATFEVTNTGNGPEAYLLSLDASLAGNDFDPIVDGLAIDSNNNGVFDPGVDQLLGAGEASPLLAADENLTVFALLTVPDSVTDGAEASVALTAAAATGTGEPGTVFSGQGVDGSNAIVGSTSATASATAALLGGIMSVDLTKSADVVDPFGGDSAVPGSVITFTINASVSGTGSATDLVVSDPIPDGTSYLPESLALDGISLTDASDDDDGEADAEAIEVDLGTVPGGTSRTVTFQVLIQ